MKPGQGKGRERGSRMKSHSLEEEGLGKGCFGRASRNKKQCLGNLGDVLML